MLFFARHIPRSGLGFALQKDRFQLDGRSLHESGSDFLAAATHYFRATTTFMRSAPPFANRGAENFVTGRQNRWAGTL